MQFRAIRSAACCLLTGVLTANNGLPLALEHAHPVGRNLKHDVGRGHGLPLHAQRESGRECSASILSVTAHVHLVWLGFEFTLLPPDDTDNDPDDTPPASISLARLIDNSLSIEFDQAVGPHLFAIDSSLDAVRRLKPAATAKQTEASEWRFASLPLCDTARHERSGVQLI
jgi:hypothetical protein